MSRGLTAFVIATACVTTLIVIGAPLLRLASNSGKAFSAADDPRQYKGREFFETYVRLEQTYDPAILDLYSDSAIIIDRRPSANGQKSDLIIPAAAFKPMFRSMIPLAKAKGDPPSSYNEVKQFVEGDGVRIECDCYSQREEFLRHLSMLVMPAAEDSWLIYELVVDSPEPR